MEPIIAKNNLAETIDEINNVINPAVLAIDLSFAQSSMLRAGLMGFYESYFLNFEILKLRRLSYIQPAWGLDIYYRDCLIIMNQYYLAQIFDDSVSAKYLYEWGIEASHLCRRDDPHYIMDRYEDFLIAAKGSKLLRELLEIRKHGNELSDDYGPYHFGVYPYDYCIPEQVLLEGNTIDCPRTVSDEIGEMIVALNLR